METVQQPKKKSFGKKLLIGISIFFAIIILIALLFPVDYYKDGLDYYNKQNYSKALNYFKNVKTDNKNYADAINKIKELIPIVDSIERVEKYNEELAKKTKDSLKLTEKENQKLSKELEKIDESSKNKENVTTTNIVKTEIEETKEQLKRELESFNKPFDGNTYRGGVTNLQMEVVLFATYASIIKEGKNSTDTENQKLATQLEKKVVERQVVEFPKMRKDYASVAAEKLWESNIYISVSGANNSIINLTGGLFSSNKNIAESQRSLSEIFSQFRFKEVRYRWYKGAEEFTFYKLDTPKDSELIISN